MSELTSLAVYANEDWRLEILATALQATASEGDIVAVWRMAQRSPDQGGWGVDVDWQWLGTPANGPSWAKTDIVLARNSDGRLEAAVIVGQNGEIWHAWQTEPGKDWSKWHSLGRPKLHTGLSPWSRPSTPAMMVNADGRLELFTEAEGAVWHRWQLKSHRGPWHDWHSLGGPRPGLTRSTLAGPTVGRNKDGRLELFVALEDEVWHMWQTPVKTGWSQWSPLGNPGTGVDLLAVARDLEGRLVLVATTYGGGLWYRSQPAAGQGPWEPWTPLDTPADAKVIWSIALRRQQDGRLVLIAFHPTSDNGRAVWLLQQTDPDGAWTDRGRSLGEHPRGGFPDVNSPFLVRDRVGQLLLFFRMVDTTDLYWLRQDGPNGTEWAVNFERHSPPTGSP